MTTGCCDRCGGDVRVWQCLQNDAVRRGKCIKQLLDFLIYTYKHMSQARLFRTL